MKLLCCKSEAGFSLLEQALVLPIALTFIVGVLDVNSIFQANTAMHDGVTEALRCLTPTDGDCTIGGSGADVLYEVKRSKAEMRWEVPEYSYNANLSYYSAPTVADANITLQTGELPMVKTDKDPLHPTFPDGGEGQSASKPRQLSAVITGSNGYKKIGAVQVGTLPQRYEDNCYVAKKVNDKYVPTAERCRKNIKFMIQIDGEVKSNRGTETLKGSTGKVWLYMAVGETQPIVPEEDLSEQSILSKGWIGLGGQTFDSGADGAFYTRGADPKKNISNPYNIQEYTQKYNLKLRGKSGDNVFVLLVLEKKEGEQVAWSAKSVKMYTEQFKSLELCNIMCQDISDSGKCSIQYEGLTINHLTPKKTSVLTACAQIGKCEIVTGQKAPDGTTVSDGKLFVTSDEFKKDETVQCLNPKTFNYADAIEDKDSSLLYGKHEPSCNWKDIIKNEIENINKSESPYREELNYVSFANITRKKVDAKLVKARPAYACGEVEQKATAIGDYQTIKGSPMRWEDIPAECFNSYDYVCDISSPTFIGNPTSLSHNTDLAVARAENAIYSSLPWSKSNCEGNGCSVVAANADGNDFTVTAQVTVPLRLFSMLGLAEHNPVIRRTESAVWEGAFAR